MIGDIRQSRPHRMLSIRDADENLREIPSPHKPRQIRRFVPVVPGGGEAQEAHREQHF
jgi:hypothetical protein